MLEFIDTTHQSGAHEQRRQQQSIEWMHSMIEEELRNRYLRSEKIQQLLPSIEAQVANNTLPATTAVHMVMKEI